MPNPMGLIALTLTMGVHAATAVPDIALIVPDEPAWQNEPYCLSYEVSWDGDAGDYVIVPPDVESPDWAVATLTRSRAELRNGRNVVAFDIEYVPAEPGSFEVPGLAVEYIDPGVTPESEDPGAESGPLPTLHAASVSVLVQAHRPIRSFLVGLGALGTLGALGWAGSRLMRRAPVVVVQSTQGIDIEAAQAALHEAKRRRLDGDYYGFYTGLKRGVALLGGGEAGATLAAQLDEHTRAVGYKGVRPTDDDMDGALRDAERAVRRAGSDTQVPGQ